MRMKHIHRLEVFRHKTCDCIFTNSIEMNSILTSYMEQLLSYDRVTKEHTVNSSE